MINKNMYFLKTYNQIFLSTLFSIVNHSWCITLYYNIYNIYKYMYKLAVYISRVHTVYVYGVL